MDVDLPVATTHADEDFLLNEAEHTSPEIGFLSSLAETAANTVYEEERGADFIERHVQIWDARLLHESQALTNGTFGDDIDTSDHDALVSARARQELVVTAAENELKTWMLLRHLRKVEDIVSASAYAAIRDSPIAESDYCSASTLAEKVIQRDPELLRSQAVVDWLESTGPAAPSSSDVLSLTFRHTLSQYAYTKSTSPSSLPSLHFDSDAVSIASGNPPVTDARDAAAETKVLQAAFRCLRAGRPDAAAETLRAAQLHWRAALLAGDSMPGLAVDENGAVTEDGNAAYFQYKAILRSLALSPVPTSTPAASALGVAERALYGLVANEPVPALAAASAATAAAVAAVATAAAAPSGTATGAAGVGGAAAAAVAGAGWEDGVWVRFKCLVGATVDSEVAGLLRAHAVDKCKGGATAVSKGPEDNGHDDDDDDCGMSAWLSDRYDPLPAGISTAAASACAPARAVAMATDAYAALIEPCSSSSSAATATATAAAASSRNGTAPVTDAAGALSALRREFPLALYPRTARSSSMRTPASNSCGDGEDDSNEGEWTWSAAELASRTYRETQELLILGDYSSVEPLLARRLAVAAARAGLDASQPVSPVIPSPKVGGTHGAARGLGVEAFSFGTAAGASTAGVGGGALVPASPAAAAGSSRNSSAAAAEFAALVASLAAFSAHLSLYLFPSVPLKASPTEAGAALLAAQARSVARAGLPAAVPVYCDILPPVEMVREFAAFLSLLPTTDEQQAYLREGARFERLRAHLLQVTKQLVQTVLSTDEISLLTHRSGDDGTDSEGSGGQMTVRKGDALFAAPGSSRRASLNHSHTGRRRASGAHHGSFFHSPASTSMGGSGMMTPGSTARGAGSAFTTPVTRALFLTPSAASAAPSPSSGGAGGLASPGGFLSFSTVHAADDDVSPADARRIAVVGCFAASGEADNEEAAALAAAAAEAAAAAAAAGSPADGVHVPAAPSSFSGAYLLEALLHANGLARLFAAQGKLAAVRALARATEALAVRAEREFSREMLAVVDPVAGAALAGEIAGEAGSEGDVAGDATEAAEARGNAGRELLAWRYYLTALEWLEAWRVHHADRPDVLVAASDDVEEEEALQEGLEGVEVDGPSVSAARKAQRAAQRAKDYAEWEATDKENVASLYSSLQQVLAFPGGWLTDCSLPRALALPAPERLAETAALRRACLPQLVLSFMRACVESGDTTHARAAITAVADPCFRVHSAFSPVELGFVVRLAAEAELSAAVAGKQQQ